ncbi:MAG: protein-L-isoaspartate O-methyltransferase [Gammaproteobacteria bacterium]|nr:MAG: protein-L-isoaspartate O-methyltransferase [Gammaproteobacteria bacterium]
MVENQIRPWEVFDERVLSVIRETPREDFVPPAFRKLAYADINIPLGKGEVMMTPKVEGRMLQALSVEPTDRVLEVGTGSGYVTALLAKLGKYVFSVEIHPEFKLSAEEKLAAHGLANITLEVGDAARGWRRHAPYDVIAITGSLPILPQAFRESLAIGGRLFAILGEAPVMEATLVTREGADAWLEEGLFETFLPPLINAPRPRRFLF